MYKFSSPIVTARVSKAITLAAIFGATALSGCDDDGASPIEADASDAHDATDSDVTEPACVDGCDVNEACVVDVCVCAEGFINSTDGCVAIACESDDECDNGVFCDGKERCDTDANACVADDPVECADNSSCVEFDAACVCDAGFEEGLEACEALGCLSDEECENDIACDGAETCDLETGECAAGQQVSCGEGLCEEDEGEAFCACESDAVLDGALCVRFCPVPQAATFDVVASSIVLKFDVSGATSGTIETAVLALESSIEDAEWVSSETVSLAEYEGDIRVVARYGDDECTTRSIFESSYQVRDNFAPASGVDGTTAILADDERLVAWADEVSEINYGSDVSEGFMTPDNAIGAADRTIVSFGRGGDATFAFSGGIANGPGPDFAVFENSFNDTFLELGFCEVSSDGETFVRFSTAYLGETPVGAFGVNQPTLFAGFVGKYRGMVGTPFDLELLANRPEVVSGALDLDAVSHVRLVDIYGDGLTLDSFGNAIYDPTPTVGSAGIDIDAIGVLNEVTPN